MKCFLDSDEASQLKLREREISGANMNWNVMDSKVYLGLDRLDRCRELTEHLERMREQEQLEMASFEAEMNHRKNLHEREIARITEQQAMKEMDLETAIDFAREIESTFEFELLGPKGDRIAKITIGDTIEVEIDGGGSIQFDEFIRHETKEHVGPHDKVTINYNRAKGPRVLR